MTAIQNKTHYQQTRDPDQNLIRYIGLALLIAMLLVLAGCDKAGPGKREWDEELVMGNGTVIWVHRTASFVTGMGDMSGTGGGTIDGVITTITVPKDNPVALPPPVWRFEDAVPILMDYNEEKQTWYVVATFYMCGIWVQWGWPMPPYRQYEVQNGQWVVVPLDDKLIGRESNLTSAIVRNQSSRLTAAERKRMALRSGDVYKKIDGSWNSCRDYAPRR
ncbi:hypothetical protein [Saezia sanguinis]|uniref:hypothetical protein n=1 Tax=Saezia sanguinis TaxID=1965230 RepID=UPI00305DC943